MIAALTANWSEFPDQELAKTHMSRPTTTPVCKQLTVDRRLQQESFDALTPIEAVIQIESYREARLVGQSIFHPYYLAIGARDLQEALRA